MSVQGVIEFYIEIATSRRGGIHMSVYMHVNVCTMIVQTSTACNPRQFCGSIIVLVLEFLQMENSSLQMQSPSAE